MKILIIKLGYSETLDPEIGRVVSLGDVVRTTPLLGALREMYPDAHITWLTDENAEPLLLGIPHIDRLLVWDQFVPFQIAYEQFDILINLEKVPGICALADQVHAWQKFGFRFLPHQGTYMMYAGGEEVFGLCNDPHMKKTNTKPWQQILIEMVGGRWRRQPYLVGCSPPQEAAADVGLNYLVGSKWPNKAWPMESWQMLETVLIRQGYVVSWQQGKNDLHDYMAWLGSCRLIITNDSLGLHLAQALQRKVVGLFGPTSEKEVFFYGVGCAVVADNACGQRPCLSPKCRMPESCITAIHPEKVAAEVRALLAAVEETRTAPVEQLYRRRRISCDAKAVSAV